MIDLLNLHGENTISYHDFWDKPIKGADELANGDPDLFASVGATQLHSEGDFTITKQDDTYTVTGIITHTIQDLFDFNKGDTFVLPDSKGFPLQTINADDLKKYDGAHDFIQNAQWPETVTAKGTLHGKRIWDLSGIIKEADNN